MIVGVRFIERAQVQLKAKKERGRLHDYVKGLLEKKKQTIAPRLHPPHHNTGDNPTDVLREHRKEKDKLNEHLQRVTVETRGGGNPSRRGGVRPETEMQKRKPQRTGTTDL